MQLSSMHTKFSINNRINNKIDKTNKKTLKNTFFKFVLVFLPIFISFICLFIGRTFFSPLEFITLSSTKAMILWKIRLPRILCAFLVGSGLSVSGCVFQSFFANPLAAPDTVGVSGGACFGSILGILFGFNLLGIQLLSVFFGIIALFATFLICGKKNNGEITIILSGIIVSATFSALSSFLKYIADSQTVLPSINFWLMGSFSLANYKTLVFCAPLILIPCAILFFMRWHLNALVLSFEEAVCLGINIKFLKTLSIFCATIISSACVCVAGLVGWVGILVPHICRLKFGNDNRILIPASFSFGASFLIFADTLCRSLSPSEIPLSVVTAILACPFFIFVVRKYKGWKF